MSRYQNISIQPVLRANSKLFKLPDANLSGADVAQKSTSDRTKRRVARETSFPRPVIKRPIVEPKVKTRAKNDSKPIHVFEQCSDTYRTKKRRGRKPKNAAGPSDPQSKSNSQEDEVSGENSKKRKSEESDSLAGETPSKKTKKNNSSSGKMSKLQKLMKSYINAGIGSYWKKDKK